MSAATDRTAGLRAARATDSDSAAQFRHAVV